MSFSKAVDLLRLARLASGRVGISLDEIEREFGVVRRTAQRMGQALAEVFPDAEDYYDDEGRKRWRLPPRRVAEFLAPQAEEIAALDLVIERLNDEGDSAARALKNLRDTVQALIPDRHRFRLEADREALLEAMGHAARPGPRPRTREDVDEAIATALKGPFVLTISYRSRNDPAPRQREIEPYGLLLGTRRYLVARDQARDTMGLRHYRVEDIEHATLHEDSFERPPGFDIHRYAQRAFGAFQNEDEYGPVEWRFSPRAAPHAARFRFHPAQELEWAQDGSLTIRFNAAGWLEMCWHLYAWGQEVEVIRPQALKDMVVGYQREFPALP